MFHKKKFNVAEKENEKKMYNAKNIRWLHYLIIVALVAFVLLMILANVKSKSYYKSREAAKKANKEMSSTGTRSFLSLDEISSRAVDCSIKYCAVTCTGDIIDLNNYLNNQKSCPSMTLTITGGSFPDDKLQSDWLKGTFTLTYINITKSALRGIDNGAFNQNTVATMKELKLEKVKLPILTEDSFVGLKAVEIFTLVNEIEIFSGDSFLKPMQKTLKTLWIQHITNTPTDPGPWLRGNYPELSAIYFQNNNFGGFINMDTFQHLDKLYFLSMGNSKINYLPDGVFDFMMSRFLATIFIQDNQLKRITGNYLTKVSWSKLTSLIALNNPWDCTCELEDFIREYKRDPTGFGGELFCSTPPELAGKPLSQVTVDRCEDTTTILPTTLSSSTTTTTTVSTQPPSSSPPVTSPTSTISSTIPSTGEPTTISSSSTTEGSESPTSPEIPTSSPENTHPPSSTTSTSEAAIPTTSSEPSSTTEEPTESTPDNVTPYAPESTSTTALTTLPIGEGTSPPPQTTPSPQNRTTTMSAVQTVTIECQRYSAEITDSPGLYVELSRPDTYFYITSLSETSAQLTMESTSDEMALIWFFDQPMFNGSGENIRIVGEFKIGCQSELKQTLLIEGLLQRQAYTFCLVMLGVQVVSPFNCLSYYYTDEALVGKIDETEVWLKREQKALTIGLLILGIILSICLGACGMFLILRVRPTLLKSSKRVIVVNRSTGDILVMPRPGGKSSTTDSSYRDSFETNTTIPQRRFSEASIHSGRSYMMANNYEDIEYRWKMNIVNDMIYANRVPKSPPPPLPKRISQDTCTGKANDDKMKIAVVYQKSNDYGYIA